MGGGPKDEDGMVRLISRPRARTAGRRESPVKTGRCQTPRLPSSSHCVFPVSAIDPMERGAFTTMTLSDRCPSQGAAPPDEWGAVFPSGHKRTEIKEKAG